VDSTEEAEEEEETSTRASGGGVATSTSTSISTSTVATRTVATSAWTKPRPSTRAGSKGSGIRSHGASSTSLVDITESLTSLLETAWPSLIHREPLISPLHHSLAPVIPYGRLFLLPPFFCFILFYFIFLILSLLFKFWRTEGGEMHSTTIRRRARPSPSLPFSSSPHLSSTPPVMPLFLPNREWFHLLSVLFLYILLEYTFFFLLCRFVLFLKAQTLFCFIFIQQVDRSLSVHSVLVWGLGGYVEWLCKEFQGCAFYPVLSFLWMKCKLFVPFS